MCNLNIYIYKKRKTQFEFIDFEDDEDKVLVSFKNTSCTFLLCKNIYIYFQLLFINLGNSMYTVWISRFGNLKINYIFL